LRSQESDPLHTTEGVHAYHGTSPATGGNGFRLFSRFCRRGDLRPVATGCNDGAPQRLHPLLSILATNHGRFPVADPAARTESTTSSDVGAASSSMRTSSSNASIPAACIRSIASTYVDRRATESGSRGPPARDSVRARSGSGRCDLLCLTDDGDSRCGARKATSRDSVRLVALVATRHKSAAQPEPRGSAARGDSWFAVLRPGSCVARPRGRRPFRADVHALHGGGDG